MRTIHTLATSTNRQPVDTLHPLLEWSELRAFPAGRNMRVYIRTGVVTPLFADVLHTLKATLKRDWESCHLLNPGNGGSCREMRW